MNWEPKADKFLKIEDEHERELEELFKPTPAAMTVGVGSDPTKRMWRTRDGKHLPIAEMGDDHIRYAIRALEKEAKRRGGVTARVTGSVAQRYRWLCEELAKRGLEKLPVLVNGVDFFEEDLIAETDKAFEDLLKVL